MTLIITGAVVAAAQSVAEKEAVKMVVQYVKEKVIGRWSEHRAEKFFHAFLDEVRKETDVRYESADLNDMLRKVAATDKQTTALFDAYRRVALSSSKDIGPMIIGMLTAMIVLQDRDATADEELIFQGAEILNDRDFHELHEWLATTSSKNSEEVEKGELRVLVKTGPLQPVGDSMSRMASGIDDIPLDIAREVGIFSLKLKNIGLMADTMRRRESPREPGATRYYVIVSAACRRLDQLAARAKSATG